MPAESPCSGRKADPLLPCRFVHSLVTSLWASPGHSRFTDPPVPSGDPRCPGPRAHAQSPQQLIHGALRLSIPVHASFARDLPVPSVSWQQGATGAIGQERWSLEPTCPPARELLRVTGHTPDPRQNRPLEEGPMARPQSLTSPSVPQAAGILPGSLPSDRGPPPPAGLKLSGADMHMVLTCTW